MRSGELVAHRYRIEGALGRGGMARTFVARDLVADVDVSLKHLELRSSVGLEAFRREFILLARLHHLRLCRVIDFFAEPGDAGSAKAFYTAEYVAGTTLGEFARSRRWAEVEPSFLHSLEALGFLHRAGIAHGDFKPSNVIVAENGDGVLIDLGCARRLDDAPLPGTLSGTREFIAPELLQGRSSASADLFSVGMTLRKLGERLGAPLPPHVSELARRLLESEPAKRPADVAEVLTVLGVKAPKSRMLSVPGAELVGRERELAAFEHLLDGLMRREAGPRVLWVWGEPGVGRSRLLREMKWRASLSMGAVEADAKRRGAISAMLARADGRPLEDALPAVLARWRDLQAQSAPLVFVLDDVDVLGDAEEKQLGAMLRLIEADSRVVLLCASTEPPREPAPALASLELRTLTASEISAWLGTGAQVDEIYRITGGFPDEIVALSAELGTREIALADLGQLGKRKRTAGRRLERIRSLAESSRRFLAAIAALGGSATPSELDALGATADALALDLGFVDRIGSTFRLRRTADAERVEELTHRETMRALHRAAAELRARELEKDAHRPECLARVCESLIAAGDSVRAGELLRAHENDAYRLPRELRRVAARLLALDSLDAPSRLLAAELSWRAGDTGSVLTGLSRMLAERPNAEIRAEIRRIAGSAYAAIGDTRRARKMLARAAAELERRGRRESAARAVEQWVLAELKHGDYERALGEANRALQWTDDPGTQSALHAGAGIAASYLGELDQARSHLDRAVTTEPSNVDPRTLVRSESARALIAYRSGDTRGAREAYRRAHQRALDARLDDLVAPTALNHGVACHQAGDYGAALVAYERGLDLAVALGMPSTELTLLVNLAKLYAEIGLSERALAHAARASELARRQGQKFLEAAAACASAEAAVLGDDPGRARELLESARTVFVAERAERELLEVEIDIARLDAESEPGLAISRLGSLSSRVVKLGARDLLARLRLAESIAHASAGNLSIALSGFETVEQIGREVDQLALQTEALARAATATQRAGLHSLAKRHGEIAREQAERTAATLPAELRAAFFRHPVRRMLETSSETPSGNGRDALRLRHVLDMNRRLSSALTTNDVLEAAIDSAIELSGAERGFLILRVRGQFQVPIARNVDRERIGKSHLKFSKSIAERVVTSGEPVVTIDAASDARFRSNRSVHAMRLKSVMAVPIRSVDRVLGAIYLDNRFRSQGFAEEDVDLVLAFADQVGIALGRAELHDQLVVRTRQLELERKRVEELARGQREEIERLATELDRSRLRPAERREYADIVGESRAMRRVFDTLDRVVSTELTVLIRGESGTGKELIARALHDNGPRRGGPLVAINCGALPDQLLEAELFGYRRGAFTGAVRDHPGLFVMAEGGTLFLDELGEMSTSMQVKLLRTLQEREVRPLGADAPRSVDARVICATNRDLRSEIEVGNFREDLYYRVAVVEIVLPPLRERLEDLPLIADRVLERAAKRAGKSAPDLSPGALRLLASHRWPGNVRELENVLTKAWVLSGSDVLDAEHIEIQRSSEDLRARRRRGADASGVEATEIQRTLATHGWNASDAARALGMSRATFYRRLKSYGLERPTR